MLLYTILVWVREPRQRFYSVYLGTCIYCKLWKVYGGANKFVKEKKSGPLRKENEIGPCEKIGKKAWHALH